MPLRCLRTLMGKCMRGTKAEEEDEQSDNEEDLDKQMGDLGDAEADKLDKRLWGDDDDDEEENDDENKAEEQGHGMDTGESELVAKDDNQDAGNSDKDKKNLKDEAKEEQIEDGRKDKIHEQIDEREYDDNEMDPFHGKQDTQQEPESLDLPDDLNLENDEGKVSGDEKDENGEDGNPFDIDEKPMEINEESKEQEDSEGNSEKEIQESEETEQATEQDNNKEEELQEEGPQETEKEVEEAEEKGEKVPDSAKDTENNENELQTEQGLMPQNDEKPENKVQDSTERMEHETYGKTAEDNLQSDDAAELAGAASEKDEAKQEHGNGYADASQSEGHESKLMARLASQKQSVRNTQSIKRKPGQADDDRTLGDQNEQVHKRLRTMDTASEMGNEDKQAQQNEEADAYEHIKQGAQSYDAQTYDTASKDQEKSQPHKEEQDNSTVQDVEMESKENETLEAVNVEHLKPEEKRSNESITQAGPEESKLDLQGLMVEDVQRKDVEPTNVDKEKHERSTESTIHTAWEFLKEGSAMTPENPEELRRELEKQLEEWQTHPIGDAEEEKAASEMWQRYLLLTGSLSQQLCEQLRLILEPTQAAKLKGDYRTGKRLNMRKVIPYIASQFRKDKIWLRRTKPSKRQYQICLAIDDSASMVDNHSKQLAYEALAVIGNALTLLEVGQIAVYSFGENVKLLHPFHEQFSEQSGSRILNQCKFQQKKTLLAQFLESSVPMFEAAQRLSPGTNPETAQLLIIVSDGRGIFVEGKDRVTNAVKAARNANIFIIFIILDNPMSKDSILDIKVPIFTTPKEMPKMISYMEQFPFPFYIILRDVNSLPETLSDALRQWFELVTTSEYV
ncbi:unnamed protein product [Staurois parvus]|uniref:VWFA domain-containing protein n=1 Tax=Staurois parvus TaxID=386267 RepID=A0ABN9EWW7_9NEOB|nr:unnamed protein product [Staurois parvus]